VATDKRTDRSSDTVHSDSVYWTGEIRLWAGRRSADRGPVSRSPSASSVRVLCRPQGGESTRSGLALMGPRNIGKKQIKGEVIWGGFE
jgi:hypothetical protein